MPTRSGSEWLEERFEEQRPHLRSVAYRMLGSLSEAEDAVQDAWLRLSRSDISEVENLGAWLTTVVARLCLDMLRTRSARREDPLDLRLPDPIVASPETSDPEHEALLADSVGLAMLVVLETLSPAERLAFVLHDTFGLPFDEIAGIVGRSPIAARQLASRARRRVRGAATVTDTSPARQRELIQAFLAAAREGDFVALLRILDPDVVVHADMGAAGPALGRQVRGAEAVAGQALSFRSLAPGATPATVNGAPGLLVFAGDRLYAILGFTIRGDRIVEIDIMGDPDRIRSLDLGGFRRPSA
jgi:RNA polymerase sigma-70 factor, ECF subfamily